MNCYIQQQLTNYFLGGEDVQARMSLMPPMPVSSRDSESSAGAQPTPPALRKSPPVLQAHDHAWQRLAHVGGAARVALAAPTKAGVNALSVWTCCLAFRPAPVNELDRKKLNVQ